MREAALLERLVHGEDHFLVLERLGDVVEGTMLHGLDRPVDGGEGGDDDDRQRRIRNPQRAQRVDAADAGQHDVEDDEVDVVVLVEHGQRFFAARGHRHFEAFAAQNGVEHVAENFFVVDYQNAHRHQFGATDSVSTSCVVAMRCRGNVMVNSAPWPGVLSTVTSPSDA